MGSISLYLKQFVLAPRTTGTVLPSSRYLCEKMLQDVDWENITEVVELGAGDGILTKKILEKMRPDAVLKSFEIRPEFVEKLRTINDNRLTICDYSAEFLNGDCDVIFSCVPLVVLPKKVSIKILKSCVNSLRLKNGLFIQFHYSRLCEKLISRYFSFKRHYVFRNIPPAFVYKCSIKLSKDKKIL